MRVTLIINMGSVAISSGAFAVGIFGMNLLSGLETHPTMFFQVTSTIFCGSISIFVILYSYYRRTKVASKNLSGLSRTVSDLRAEQSLLFTHSDRAKVLYNYSACNIGDKAGYQRFLKNSRLNFLEFNSVTKNKPIL